VLVRVEYEEAFKSYKVMNSNIIEVTLTTDDIPGSELSEPFSKHKADSLAESWYSSAKVLELSLGQLVCYLLHATVHWYCSSTKLTEVTKFGSAKGAHISMYRKTYWCYSYTLGCV